MTRIESEMDLGHVRDMLARGGYATACRDGAPWPDASRWWPMEEDRPTGPPSLSYADTTGVDGLPYGSDPDQVENEPGPEMSQWFDYEEQYIQPGVLLQRRRGMSHRRVVHARHLGRLTRLGTDLRLPDVPVEDLCQAADMILDGPGFGRIVSDSDLAGLLAVMFSDGRRTWASVEAWIQHGGRLLIPASIPVPLDWNAEVQYEVQMQMIYEVQMIPALTEERIALPLLQDLHRRNLLCSSW